LNADFGLRIAEFLNFGFLIFHSAFRNLKGVNQWHWLFKNMVGHL
jgi:hypothetical protein